MPLEPKTRVSPGRPELANDAGRRQRHPEMLMAEPGETEFEYFLQPLLERVEAYASNAS